MSADAVAGRARYRLAYSAGWRAATAAAEADLQQFRVERHAMAERVVMLEAALAAAEQRAARLAALETAAIAYRAWWVAYDGLEGNLVEGHRLLTALRQATAALAAPAAPEGEEH